MSITLPRSVVYFPTIEFQDEGFLRASLCTWEHVHRIVPHGHTPRDSDVVRRMVDSGMVVSINLAPADLDQAAAGFTRLLKTASCRPSALHHGQDEMAHLHKGKVGERLHEFFEHVRTPNTDNDDWYGLPRELAHGYMMFLAEAVARRRGMAKVSDDKDAFSVSAFYDTDGCLDGMGYSSDDRMGQAILGLTKALPAGVEELSIDQLVEFRKRTAEGRALFSAEIERLATDIAKIEDPGTLRERIQDACNTLQSSKLIVNDSRTWDGRDLSSAAFYCGIPTFLTAISALGADGNPFALANIAGGAAIALVASIGQAHATKRQQPVDPIRSYYVDLETTAAQGFASRYVGRENDFWAVMEEFIND